MNDKNQLIEVALAGGVGSFDLDCTFKMAPRGVTALFGPSGCGKTTVLRCMAGLSRLPGKISIGGKVWQDTSASVHIPTHKRSVGYVFQESSLFPHLNVRDNLLFGVKQSKGDRGLGTENAPSFDEIVSLFGLASLLERSPLALSGGERKRVAIGRALLAQPVLLLMDEPLSGLDQHTKNEILPYLDRLHQNLNIPMLYVSHDIEEVVRLADRVIMMAEGRVVMQGQTSEIFEHLDYSKNAENGDIGAVVTATVCNHDNDVFMTRLKLGNQFISVPCVNAKTGKTVRAFVKARDVSLAVQCPDQISIRNILKGKLHSLDGVKDTAFMNAVVDVDGITIRSQITRAAANEMSLAAGQDIYALIKSVTFDPQSLSEAVT